MNMGTRNRTALMILALVVVSASGAHAQSDDDSNGAVQFNFSTPGARSLGLGGAFLGSVDDATAAYSNPAGLLQLSEPEAMVEFRQWSYSTPFASRGRFSGTATGFGADDLSTIEFDTSDEDLEDISYASFVYPRQNWAIAFYYHQAAKFRSQFQTAGIFTRTSRLFPVQSSYDLDISQVGVSFAHKWGGFAVGYGASIYSLELDSLTQRFRTSSSFAAVDFDNDLRINYQTQTGESEELGYLVGLRWDSSVNSKTSIGLVYRFGPEFDIDVASAAGMPSSQSPMGEPAVFNLPDVLGLGFTFRPSPALTVSFDIDQVRYSQMVEDFFIIFRGDSTDPEDFVIDDVTEYHFGVEYVFANNVIPVALRVGGWWDPDHRLRFEGSSDANQARLFKGEDELHYSAGLGLVITSKFQIDLAADFSENADTAAVSAIYRF